MNPWGWHEAVNPLAKSALKQAPIRPWKSASKQDFMATSFESLLLKIVGSERVPGIKTMLYSMAVSKTFAKFQSGAGRVPCHASIKALGECPKVARVCGQRNLNKSKCLFQVGPQHGPMSTSYWAYSCPTNSFWREERCSVLHRYRDSLRGLSQWKVGQMIIYSIHAFKLLMHSLTTLLWK